MFEVSTNDRGNMYGIVVAYITLVTLSCLVCFAQDQILNPEQLESNDDSLLPSMSEAKAETDSDGAHLPCWMRPSGCTAHLRQMSLPQCARIRLAPDSKSIICVPFLSNQANKFIFSASPPLSAPFSFSSESTPLGSESNQVSIEKILKSIEAKRQKDRDFAVLSITKKNPNNEILDVSELVRLEENRSNDDENPNGNKRCTEPGDFYGDTKLVSCNEQPFSRPDSATTNSQKDQELSTHTWQGPNRQQYRQQQRHPQQQYRMNPEVVTKFLETQQQQQRQPITIPEPMLSTTASKVPIILVKFGDIRNQRRSDSAIRRQTNLLMKRPAIRLHRSDFNGTTFAYSKKYNTFASTDLDGGVADVTNRSVVASETVPNSVASSDHHKPIMSTLDEDDRQVMAKEDSPLDCNLRRYSFKALKSDNAGNKCSGLVTATICYGGCDTGEIADWLFPHKKSIHKVCTHGARIRRRVILNDCTSASVEPTLRDYHYVDARSCVCQKCNPADTTCLGSLTRPYLPSFGESSSVSSLSLVY